MNEYLQVIVLGIVQGIAEFLPISSSGHLVLTEQLLGQLGGHSIATGKELEVMLHVGTLLSILVVYAHDLWKIAFQPRTIAILVVATIPAAVVGLLLEDWFEQAFDSPMIAGFGLLVTAALLWVAQRMERARFNDGDLPWANAIVIGMFQAVALVPGISRSGSTISGGLLTGVDRLSATRFSFLLAIPVTLGAVLLTTKKIVEEGGLSVDTGPLLLGIVVSFVTGLLTLRWLIRLISQRKLHWFSIYCASVGLLTIVLCTISGPAKTSGSPSHAGKAGTNHSPVAGTTRLEVIQR